MAEKEYDGQNSDEDEMSSELGIDNVAPKAEKASSKSSEHEAAEEEPQGGEDGEEGG